MIKTEIITINGVQFQKTWSDVNYLIERDGAKYSEAFDPIGIERTYIETNEPIDNNVWEPGVYGWTELDTTE